MQHNWVKSTLGHGETMCSRCFITNREAAVLGLTNVCDAPAAQPVNDNRPAVIQEAPARQRSQDEIDSDMGQPFICPVTCQPCMTEDDEFCEDYGCARRAGIDVDRDPII